MREQIRSAQIGIVIGETGRLQTFQHRRNRGGGLHTTARAAVAQNVLRTGVSMVQVPDGIDFDGDTAYVLFGIAGKADEHLEVLGRIAAFCADENNVDRLRRATTAQEVLDLINA
ncbi:MAG: PTS sugar transporter subunit IIA [Microbacterium gubbeenense]|uniref:PTS sugar transporter subunit IIA n=2 Tax=Microbacterium gubbeenense TaxID=159896 RepID=UPI003F97AEE2